LWGEQSGAGMKRAIEVVTSAPARMLGADAKASIAVGAAADLCVFNPVDEWQVTPDTLKSQGKHTPFAGYAMRGRVRMTLVGGRIVHHA
ncbi:MAG: amidohydrolase family protein, partial [Variovorax sp.]